MAMPSSTVPPTAILAAPIDAVPAPAGAKCAAVPVLPQAAAPSRIATAPPADCRATGRAELSPVSPDCCTPYTGPGSGAQYGQDGAVRRSVEDNGVRAEFTHGREVTGIRLGTIADERCRFQAGRAA